MIFKSKIVLKEGKPILYLNKGVQNLRALVDTGADLPMFSGNFSKLKELYPDAVLMEDTVLIGGINGYGEYFIANIPLFELGNINFKQFKVAVWSRSVYDYDFLLSSTMFEHMILNIDYVNEIITIQSSREVFGTVLRDIGAVVNEKVHKRLKVLMQEH